mgnify:CR=1 FL=1|tara:strand:- start:20 stop:259 length:240 start_codon:yes stop_codon:yes gene_type:complete
MIQFDKMQKAQLHEALQDYLVDECDTSLGEFEVEFLLDFISEKIGPYYYNQGLKSAQAVLMNRLDTITEAIDEIVKDET